MMAYKPPDLPYHGPVAHTSGTGNLPINRIVIHCTAGADGKGATGTARYFQDPAATGSAHYITDSDESIQCARDNVVCWHAPPNPHSIGIEMECSLAGDGKGHWTRADHIAMMHRTAKLTAQKCLQYGVPIVKLSPADLVAGKRGVCGHVDVTNAFHQSTHTDPGSYFPWAQFMGWVHAEAALITGSSGGTPTPPKGNDVQLSDPVGPDHSDPKTPLTLGEASNRGGYAYWNTMKGGPLFELVQAQQANIVALEARLAKLEAAPKA